MSLNHIRCNMFIVMVILLSCISLAHADNGLSQFKRGFDGMVGGADPGVDIAFDALSSSDENISKIGIAELWTLAKEGNSKAKFLLALLYDRGIIVKKNEKEAFQQYYSIANELNPSNDLKLYYSISRVGDMYYSGVGVGKDHYKAVEWYEKGLNGNTNFELFSASLVNLSTIYLYDLVDKDKAEKILLIASRNANKDANNLLENEFGWKCMYSANNSEKYVFNYYYINKSTIVRDKNNVWYWGLSQSLNKSQSNGLMLKKYYAVNCANNTEGVKSSKVYNLNYDYSMNLSIESIPDKEVDMKPVDNQLGRDNIKYVCSTHEEPITKDNNHMLSQGTGWVAPNGYLITNYHVVKGKSKIYVIGTNGKRHEAQRVVEDKINDIAVLKFEHGEQLASLKLSKSGTKSGQKVFTIGYPHAGLLGINPKVTDGIISANTGVDDDPRFLQITVPLQNGNSGGPLLNENGEVVGIVSAKLDAIGLVKSTGDLPQNVNYALKIAYLNAIIEVENIIPVPSTKKRLRTKKDSLEAVIKNVNPAIYIVIAE
jgi:hypothetical protein